MGLCTRDSQFTLRTICCARCEAIDSRDQAKLHLQLTVSERRSRVYTVRPTGWSARSYIVVSLTADPSAQINLSADSSW